MRLPEPFYLLPVHFDIERLRAEVLAVPSSTWAAHPNKVDGNSSVRLISSRGGENDDVEGPMLPTPQLAQMPYLRQILASFGVVWSRSRLMRLAPGAGVPPHADINYHWFSRVRVHIPVITRPEVRFYCGSKSVHMAAGEAWLFDNWRPHRVENPTPDERIHIVADTSGSASFWQFVGRSGRADIPVVEHRYDPLADPPLLTEQTPSPRVMPPAEVEVLAQDLRQELQAVTDSVAGGNQLARYDALLAGLCYDWRQLHALHGDSAEGITHYARLRDSLREASRSTGEGLVARTNQVAVHRVFEARLLQHLLHEPPAVAAAHAGAPRRRTATGIDRPVFIVAAPRSGSTLLFETLATHAGFATLGGEAHWLVEGIDGLRPDNGGVESNRLTASHATPAIAATIEASIVARSQPQFSAGSGLRLLEKTPKNALRIPFFNQIFPDARFIFLWRDPRENLASIIEAWTAGRWVTYPQLPGWDGPWSLLLPPHWQALRTAPPEDVAAFQWEMTNRLVCDDLAALPAERSTVLRYDELIADPKGCLQRLCEFLEMPPDLGLLARVGGTLPLSRFTLTPPAAGKWQQHAAAIERVLPRLQSTWDRLRAL